MKKYILILSTALLTAGNASSQAPELVKEVADDIKSLTVVNDKLFFYSQDSVWVSDGMASGTHLLKEIPHALYEGVSQFTACNGKTFFRASDGNGGYELWVTDGTEAGTVMVKDVNPAGTGCARILQVMNDKLYFAGNDGVNGQELWVTDGTEAGTVMVKDINPGSGNAIVLTGFFTAFTHTVYNSKLFFAANNGTNGQELWVTDGTEAGTVMVKDINPGSGSGIDLGTRTYEYNNNLFFSANDGTTGLELWVTDGTEAGTVLVKDIHSAGSCVPDGFAVANGKLYFSALSNDEGRELWVSDGTGTGTTLVKDITPGSLSSAPWGMTAYEDKIYFSVTSVPNYNGLHSVYDLWVSDGTDAGTVLFENHVQSFYVYNGHLYFGKITSDIVSPFAFDYAFYKTDGTPQGTVLLKQLTDGTSFEYPRSYMAAGGRLYFLRNYDPFEGSSEAYHINDLWVTNGTSATTQLINHADNSPLSVYNAYSNMVEYNGSLYFVKYSGIGKSLYKIAGTPSGMKNSTATGIDVVLYPNPARSIFHIQTNEPIETVSLYNAIGALVQTETRNSFSIAQLPAGIYMVQIKTEKGTTTKQLIIESD